MTPSLMLGLVGDGASGKSTLARGIVRLLGHNGVTPLCLDDYHRYSRADRLARALTDIDPAANDLDLMADHLAALRTGEAISKPVYDHHTGTHRPPETVAATGLILAYGMLTLTPASLANLFDLTVYLEPDVVLRHAWRLARDVRERGYTPDEVLALRDSRERDATRFVRTQRPLADIVVRYHSSTTPSGFDIELLLRHDEEPTTTSNLIAEAAAQVGPAFSFTPAIRDDDERQGDRLLIHSTLAPDEATQIAQALASDLPTLAASPLSSLGQINHNDPPTQSLPLALTQLIIVGRLLRG
ncbi:MAG: phosphoribulokinase [Candidatus Viridilinea halotolerans]|uniref:Phosphoribulokinase n=1 Tax=Candidatus Viridilinea halotolerans TaxID=2491704 RepID=A0A426TR23_9CHLR|nr:MAG: phosphoribulokinase [Candidatus Viridilinea halotolerans]